MHKRCFVITCRFPNAEEANISGIGNLPGIQETEVCSRLVTDEITLELRVEVSQWTAHLGGLNPMDLALIFGRIHYGKGRIVSIVREESRPQQS